MKTDYTLNKTKRNNGLKLIYSYFRPHWRILILITLIIIISSSTGLAIPYLAEHIIDNNLKPEESNNTELIQSILLIALLSISSIIATYFQIRLTGRLGQKVLFEVRNDIFEKLQELPQRFFATNKSGDIIARLTSDVEAISRFLNEGIIRLLGVSFTLVIVLIILFTSNSFLASVVVVAMLMMIGILLIQGRVLRKVLKRSLDLDANVSNQIQEILNGFRTVKIYGQEKLMLSRFKKKNESYFRTTVIANFINSLSQPLLNLISLSTTLILVILSLNLYSEGNFTEGAVVSYIVYAEIFFRPLRNISGLWKTVQDGIASAQRIDEILSLESDIKEPNPNDAINKVIKGDIEFKNVTFGYSEQNVLENINFKIPANTTVAIVGPTGGGKTTFVNIIARLYDTNIGEVLADGHNVKDWNIQSLRSQLGYLLQDTFLFEDTVLNNLRYGNPTTTEKEAKEILEKIGAWNFVSSLPEGINTILKANGDNISAGQRQLIAIARLLLRKPRIIILDEATSNIDTKTEKLVQDAIEYATQNVTSFVIAHRLSTIKNADIIILIQNNTVLESGSLTKLLEQKGEFFNIYNKFLGIAN